MSQELPAGFIEVSKGVFEKRKVVGEIIIKPKTITACDLTIKPSNDEAKLNKTERAYLAYLRRMIPTPIGIQNITLKLGDDCRYSPDFNYINENGRFVFAETKGFMRDDALVKLKVAARMYRWADFQLVIKDGVGWKIEEVKA